MGDKESSPPPNLGASLRRAYTIDESANLRNRRHLPDRVSELSGGGGPGAGAGHGYGHGNGNGPGVPPRRRSSTFSDLSLAEARRAFQSSTDDLLLPRPSDVGAGGRHEPSHSSSAWHSAPLAFALLPAIGGMFFKNGSSVITDVMLLGLAAIFLNWSVRLPWDWYHSAQAIRKREEYHGNTTLSDDSEDDGVLSASQATLDEVPEEEEAVHSPSKGPREDKATQLLAIEVATNELYTHEVLALLSCFGFPLLGAYLLHTIRSQLSRPSEGLVSNYNLTIFLLASELRPMAHLVKLIQARTLHLQRLVNSNPHFTYDETSNAKVRDLVQRIQGLEERASTAEAPATSEPPLSTKQSTMVTTEVRRTLQPDLDALNRAVRRYEKRATIQAFQTESKLQELESRLNDAISLAAAAANNGQRQRGFTVIIAEGIAAAAVLPFHAITAVASIPLRTLNAIIHFGVTKVTGRQPSGQSRKGKAVPHNRVGDRLQGRSVKR